MPIPGYGYIFPVSAYGRMCLIAYALLGIPLTLVTMADTGKFAAQLVTRWFGDVSNHYFNFIISHHFFSE